MPGIKRTEVDADETPAAANGRSRVQQGRKRKESGLVFERHAKAVALYPPKDDLLVLKQQYADSFECVRKNWSDSKSKFPMHLLELIHLYGAFFGLDATAMSKNKDFDPGFLKTESQPHELRIANKGEFQHYHSAKERIFQLIEIHVDHTFVFPMLNLHNGNPADVERLVKCLNSGLSTATEEQIQEVRESLDEFKLTLEHSALKEAIECHGAGKHFVRINMLNIKDNFASILAIASCHECVLSFCKLHVDYARTGNPDEKRAFENLGIIRTVLQTLMDSVIGYPHSCKNENPFKFIKFEFDLCRPHGLFPIWIDSELKDDLTEEDVVKLVPVYHESNGPDPGQAIVDPRAGPASKEETPPNPVHSPQSTDHSPTAPILRWGDLVSVGDQDYRGPADPGDIGQHQGPSPSTAMVSGNPTDPGAWRDAPAGREPPAMPPTGREPPAMPPTGREPPAMPPTGREPPAMPPTQITITQSRGRHQELSDIGKYAPSSQVPPRP